MIKVIKSFGWAINGIKTVWREEINFRLECFIALAVIILAFILNFSFSELLAVMISVVLVLTAEIINTAVEDLCNKIEPNQDPLIGKIKDTMAAFVLFISFGTVVIGLLVFCHHFLNYF